jgi:Ruegeria phage superfamily II DNA/RNA helicase
LDSFTESNFEDYQHYMARLVYEKPWVYLAADMGLGKTAAVLKAVRRLLDEGVVRKVLIVAPLRVCENTWPEEIAKWDFAQALTYSLVIGTEEERNAARLEDTELHIINPANVVWLWKAWGARNWPYDMLVYDEASRLKGGHKMTKPVERKDGSVGVKRLSEFGVLSRVRFYFRKVVEMSGTPSPNGLQDLWGPMYVLDQGQRLGTTKTAFMQRWFAVNRYDYSITAHSHSFDEITGRIKDVMVSLREEDYLKLPPLIPNPIYVTLPPSVMARYREFERTMVDKEFDLEAVNGGVLTNKLLQFANGSMYVDDETAKPVHDLKLQALESVVEEACGEPMLIAYSFKFDLERIKKRFPKFRVFGESKSDKADWDAGRIPGLIIHPASAGHGLNFQYGGHIAVWYGLNWSLELYRQFIKRLHRRGQKRDHVMMHYILAKGTVDSDVLGVLQNKGATQDAITNAVRVRLRDGAVRSRE